MNKHLYIALLTLLLSFSAADAFRYTYEGTEFEIALLPDGRSCCISDVFACPKDVIIPEKVPYKHRTYTVTEIGFGAFYMKELVSVKIPNTVTTLGKQCFGSCRRLKSITIPNSVTTIMSSFISCVSLTHIEIPPSVTSIGGSAFKWCTGLRSITIPEGITRIESATFYSCRNLTHIDIPDAVTHIGAEAFCNCVALTEINLPGSLKRIEKNAFSNCIGLKRVVIPSSAHYLGHGVFSGCFGLQTAQLPNHIEELGDTIFGGCRSLREIYYPTTAPKEMPTSFEDDTYMNVILKVLRGGANHAHDYKPWCYFDNIEEFSRYDIVDCDTDDADADENHPQSVSYDLNGRPLAHPAKGINIINGKKILYK